MKNLFRPSLPNGMGVVFGPLPLVTRVEWLFYFLVCLGDISSWKKDSDGRVVSVLVSLGNVNCNLISIYAPTNRLDRSAFFPSIHQFFFPSCKIIFGGDLNCYENNLDKFGGNISLSSELSSFKSCFNFVDGWRCKHPRVSQCLWFNSDMSIGSRLDSFLLSHNLISSLSSCEISPCVFLIMNLSL